MAEASSTGAKKSAKAAAKDAPIVPTAEDITVAAQSFADSAKAASNDAADEAVSTAQTLKDGASKLGKEAGDKARTYAEEGKARAGGALDELSRMLHDAAGTVDEKLGAQYGKYARSAADAVSGFSEQVKTKQVDDLISDARGFVTRSPAIAIGTAAALGFVLVRLIKSGLDTDQSDRS